MTYVVLSMIVIVAVAAVVVVYAAYPHRGRDVPVIPWVGGAMRKAKDAVTVVEPDGTHDHDAHLAASLSDGRKRRSRPH
jgi:hypothetical protein